VPAQRRNARGATRQEANVTTANLEIRSEQRASHWVAWLVEPGQTRPAGSLLMVGQTREEAESRVREWLATGVTGY